MTISLIGVAVGVPYLASAYQSRNIELSRSDLVLIGLSGLAFRLILFPGNPVAEDDYFRYLWDGAVVASGLNPFGVSPADVIAGRVDQPLIALASEAQASGVLPFVAYADLPTIYPPLTQAVFGFAHLLAPWDVQGWKLVILALDSLAALGLLVCLRRSRLPTGLIVLYWWNPILLRYVHSGLHMEALLLAILAGFLLLVSLHRTKTAAVLLGAAIATKLWPLLVVPILARMRGLVGLDRGAALIIGLLTAGGVLAVMVHGGSSLSSFAQDWQRNDTVFALIKAGVETLGELALPYFVDSGAVSRLIAMCAVLVALSWALRKPLMDVSAVSRASLVVIATLYLAGPTGYPWYFLWMLPFLTLTPIWPLLVLSVTLPLYDLRFWYEYEPDAEIWKAVVTWAQFGPVLLLLVWTAARSRLGRST